MSRRTRKGRDVNGILVVDKPTGLTSNAVLQQVKRRFGAAKAGHTGSLDPLATGVLPICFGEATKFSQWLLESDKAYRATARLGITTDSGDSDGAVIASHPLPAGLDRALLERTVARFAGEIAQIPPMVSALKHKGQPLYKLARQGKEVEREPRRVHIHELNLVSCESDRFEIDVRCSKGTYIRTLVEDIGAALGCGAHITALRRTGAARFTLADAVTLAQLDSEEPARELDRHLRPVDAALDGLPVCWINPEHCVSILNGQPVRIAGPIHPGLVRLYCPDDAEQPDKPVNRRFLGLGEVLLDGQVKPRRLVNTAPNPN